MRPDLLLVDRQCTFRDAPHVGYQTHSHAASRAVTPDELAARRQDLPQAAKAGPIRRRLSARRIACPRARQPGCRPHMRRLLAGQAATAAAIGRQRALGGSCAGPGRSRRLARRRWAYNERSTSASRNTLSARPEMAIRESAFGPPMTRRSGLHLPQCFQLLPTGPRCCASHEQASSRSSKKTLRTDGARAGSAPASIRSTHEQLARCRTLSRAAAADPKLKRLKMSPLPM